MNTHHNSSVIAMLLAGALATAAFVPAAHADGYRGRGEYRDQTYFRPSGIDRWSGRSYFYRDCQTGAVDTYISNLRPGYGRDARPARVEKVDLCTGAVIASYVWDRDRWCQVGGGGSFSRVDWRARDIRRGVVEQRYAWGGWNGR